VRRVLLLEDDGVLGQTLSERLGKSKMRVRWVQTVAAARSEIANDVFDLWIFDIGLPDGSGMDFLAEIKSRVRETPVIFVTAQGDAETRLRGYELGAEEFIPKPFHLRELLMRIEHVMEKHLPPRRRVVEDVEIDFDQQRVRTPHGEADLPTRDLRVLRYLMEQSPRVVSRDEILDKVWGVDKFPSTRTIDNVVVRLRQALGERAGNRIESVRGAGYRWISKE
jgi:DNA-binding response OmpR family regulator